MPTDLDLLFELRENPSGTGWSLVIAKALDDEFSSYIERTGTIDGFVRVNLAESANRASAEACFNEALETAVITWQPTDPRPYLFFEQMIRLIGAFTPPSGFVKLLGYLEQWRKFNAEPPGDSEQPGLTNLAHIALQNYYPVPPSDLERSPGFVTYLSYLRGRMQERTHGPHACRRLIELHALKCSSREVAWILEQRPYELIDEILRAFLFRHTSERSTIVSEMFKLCLRSEHTDNFLQTLEDLQAKLLHSDPPVIILPNGDRVELYIAADEDYMRLRPTEGSRRGAQRINELPRSK